MESLYKGHIGTLETVLYIEVVLNSEVIVQWNLSIKDTLGSWKLSFVVLNSEVIVQWNLSIGPLETVLCCP